MSYHPPWCRGKVTRLVPRVTSWIPSSSSLLNGTLSCGLIFPDILNQIHCIRVVPNIKPLTCPAQYWLLTWKSHNSLCMVVSFSCCRLVFQSNSFTRLSSVPERLYLCCDLCATNKVAISESLSWGSRSRKAFKNGFDGRVSSFVMTI